MIEEIEAITETAKATQEVAKTAGKGIDTAQKIGSFISKIIGGTLEQGIGIWEDKLKYKRYENQLILMKKIHEKKIELGLETDQIESISMKHGIPLLEAASLEDDDYLQELWANLTINAMNKGSKFTLEKVYINVLEQLTPLEAEVLLRIYAINKYEGNILYNIQTSNLPTMITHTVENIEKSLIDSYSLGLKGEKSIKESPPPEPKTEIKLALSNLARLQCLKLAVTFGEEVFNVVHPTLFGARLCQAVMIKT